MEVGVIMDIGVRTMITAIMVAAPILLVSIVVGLAVSIFSSNNAYSRANTYICS